MRIGTYIKKRIVGPVHLWLGLASGLIIVIVSTTGCIYVFEKELKAIFYRNNIVVNTDLYDRGVEEMLPISTLLDRANTEVPTHFKATEIKFHGPRKSCYVQYYKRKEHAEDKKFIWYTNDYDYLFRVFLNPYSGEVLKVENTQWEFFWLIKELHSSLLIGPIGTTVISVSILIFVLMLITGIVLWWPHNWKSLRLGTWFYWKSATKWKRKNYDLHNVPGFYMLFFALIISITGLSWSFDWMKNSIIWTGNGGNLTEINWPKVKSNLEIANQQLGVDKVQAELFSQYPTASAHRIFFSRDSIAPTMAIPYQREDIIDSWQYFDQYSGEKLDELSFAEMTSGEKLYFYGYSMHVGSILSFPGKVLAFFAALVSASLPVTGFFIWWNRRKKPKGKGKKNGRNHDEKKLTKNSPTLLKSQKPKKRKSKEANPVINIKPTYN